MAARKTFNLTGKQEAFCHGVASGRSLTEAYKLAYNWNGRDAVIPVKASQEAAKPHVAARIQELKDKVDSRRTLSRTRKREILAAFVSTAVVVDNESEGIKVSAMSNEQLKAVEIDNKMAGHNEPDGVIVSGMGSLLQKIRTTAKKP